MFRFLRANDVFDIKDEIPVVLVGYGLKQILPFRLDYLTSSLPNVGDILLFSGGKGKGEPAAGVVVKSVKRFYDLELEKEQIILEVKGKR